jgi:hypothetical protein
METGDDIFRRATQVVTAALGIAANDLLGEGARLAPVDEATLRGSGHIDRSVTPASVTFEVSFNTPYAARQHEETNWEHPKGGQAKYLEEPLKRKAHSYEALVALAVRKAF